MQSKELSTKLIYVHDPMCSWCYGFSRVYQQLTHELPQNIEVIRLLGGLAPDSNEAMPESTRAMVQSSWDRISQLNLGVEFNYDFWKKCQPRRSTYPACRAVIAAREQGSEFDTAITRQIQQAYYQQARNPSDNETLIELAGEVGLNQGRFSKDLVAGPTHQRLLDEVATVRSIGISGFPSLVLQKGGKLESVLVSYTEVNSMLSQILK